MNIQRLTTQLRIDEGERLSIYLDIVGKVSVGNGRNLTDCGISDDERALMLSNDINKAVKLANQFPWFPSLDDVRQEVIVNMCFNMGNRILTFTMMLQAMEQRDYSNAAIQMRNSKWFAQVKARGERLANAMETGSF